MYLKRLEIFGFKSFADRTVFEFEPGVSCLVGPNGCGKSNVVDAMKWALGEQSAKSLRGKEMQDIIFNGTTTRKPLGYAEVVLCFDNADRTLALEYDEVVLGRRLYRDGASEYYINKQRCRLRDVRELFADTGLGVRSYSVIEQGKVDVLLQASSRERRVVFEEAAGISRYKQHKLSALRRLERVEKNVEILRAYVGEVEKQLRSIVRQANRARRFQLFNEQLTDKRAIVALADYAQTYRTLQEAREEVRELGDRERAAAVEAATISSETSQKEAALTDVDRLRGETVEARHALDKRINQLETDTRAGRRDIERMAEEALLAEQEAAKLESSARELGETAQRLAAQVGEAEAKAAQHKQALAEIEDRAAAAREQATECERRIAQAREALADGIQLRSQRENQRDKIKVERRAVKARLHGAQQQCDTLGERTREVAERHGAAQQQQAEAKRRAEQLGESTAAAKRERGTAQQHLEALAKRLARKHNELSGISSRLDVLEDLERRNEGLSAGVRGLLAALQEGSAPFCASIRGLVADLLEVAPEHVPAIEAVLGDDAQAIVTDDTRTALACADWLREKQLGRASFRPLDQVRRRWVDAGSILGDRRVVGVASALVQMKERCFGELAEALLGHVLVVIDRTAALELAGVARQAGVVLVTLNGERYDPEGGIAAGAGQGDRFGLVSRKNEIVRLRARQAAAEVELEALKKERSDGEALAARHAASIERLESEQADSAQRAASLATETSELARRSAELAAERERLTKEAAELAAEDEQLEAKIIEMAAQCEQATERETAARVAVEQVVAELEKTRAAASELGERLSNARVAVSEAEGGATRLRGVHERMEEDVEDNRRQMEQRREQIATLQTQRQEAQCALEQASAQLMERTAEREGVESEISKLAAQVEDLRTCLEQLRKQDRTVGEGLRQVQSVLGDARVHESSVTMQLENRVEQARRELGRDLEQEYRKRQQDGADEGLDVTPELRAEIEELEAKIEKIGAVNPEAIAEEERLRERAGFLAGQKADLDRARGSLKDVITRLNRKSRLLFEETFQQVQENFQEMFRKLFNGGRAELKLEEGVDVLEAGIEITARPPGKQPRSLSLLSGGEKTLTTIALLFAIFKSKPSPLCILDEVDAPLDDANVERFNRIVKEFLDISQFLIITHNKQTMRHASTIYGVTQQEPGVSKKISVKLENVDRQLRQAS